MARFNLPTKLRGRTENLAGGEAFVSSPELELVSILATSFMSDQYYRRAQDTLARLNELLDIVDPLFAAKAAVYARSHFHTRTVTHVMAGELSIRVKGEPWMRRFIERVVERPDDMMEILAYYQQRTGQRRPIPNAMKKGLASAFDKFDTYRLAKYRGTSKDVSLIDVVNLVHPRPVDGNREALEALVADTLRSSDTWESMLTQAGQDAGDAVAAAAAKSEVWAELVNERKIGYMALLRNLRNILEQSPETVDAALELLVDEKLVHGSKVLPFRYLTALNAVQDTDGSRDVVRALSRALDIAVDNVPKLDGSTVVVIDSSGSMGGGLSAKSQATHRMVASLLGAVFAKRNDADIMLFADDAISLPYNPDDSTLTIANAAASGNPIGHGTNFPSIFERMKSSYDRVIILSDMQGWIGHYSPAKHFRDYCERTGASPQVHSIDLAGYGTLQFPERHVMALAGFSERIFDLMAMVEREPDALFADIEAIEL